MKDEKYESWVHKSLSIYTYILLLFDIFLSVIIIILYYKIEKEEESQIVLSCP